MDALGENYDEMLKNAKKEIEESYKDEKFDSLSHPGFIIPFDNVDIRLGRRHMTMVHQNQDSHWVNHIYVENRVSGSHLSAVKSGSINDLDNLSILPNAQDEKMQKFEYEVLVSRFLVEHFKHFDFLKKICILHIAHRYQKEMGKKSVKVCDY